MLTQPRLLPTTYIPIWPVTVLPSEVKRQQRLEARQRNQVRRAREEALRALQMPLLDTGIVAYVEDRSAINASVDLDGPDVVGVGPEIDDPIDWTNEGILQLHSVLLEESLKALGAKGNPDEKMEILEWIFEPDYVGEFVKQTANGPRKVFVFNDQIPFSFAFCCKVQGHDPSAYRAFLRRNIPAVAGYFLHVAGEDVPLLQDALRKYHNPF